MSVAAFLAAGGILASLSIVILRYMRRPNTRTVAISALRFLPPLSAATRERVRWAPTAPLASPLFWLRLAILFILLAALVFDVATWRGADEERLGLRIVLDRSASMGVGSPTRMEEAIDLVERLTDHVARFDGCVEVRNVPRLSGDETALDGPSNEGLDPSAILAAAARPAAAGENCPPTHVAVVSDRPRPASGLVRSPPGIGEEVFWFQVGTPQPNTALVGADLAPSFASEGRAVLSLRVTSFGPSSPSVSPVSLTLSGPGNVPLPPMSATDLTVPGDKTVSYEIAEPGTYLADLDESEALGADNRLKINVARVSAAPIELASGFAGSSLAMLARRLGPQAETREPDTLRIAPYTSGPETAARGIYFLPATRSDNERLGYFDAVSPLLELVDLDLFEAMQPSGLDQVPDGFSLVAASSAGRLWLAERRSGQPAAIMPAPPGNAMVDLFAEENSVWLVTFLNAFQRVTADRSGALDVRAVDEDGEEIQNIRHESDTAQATAASARIEDIVPNRSSPTEERPVWPWLVALALVLLLIERLFGLATRWAR